MSSATALSESRYHPSTSETSRSPVNEFQEANQRVRNLVIVTLVLEALFLGTLAAYLLSSISWYQNCL